MSPAESVDPRDVRFNPFDPADVHEMWDRTRWLREHRPVSRPADGMVYVARHGDARATMKDRDRFISGRGFRAEGVIVPDEEKMIGEMDPPQHPRIRRLAVSALGPAAVAAEAAFTRRAADELLGRLPVGEPVDLVTRFDTPLSNAVPVHLIGAPLSDADQIERWGLELMHSEYPLYNRSARGEGIGAGFPEFSGYIDEMVRERRAMASPPDDLITRLIDAAPDGEPLSDTQIRTVIANMLLGGVSTTTNLLGNLLYVLLTDRDLWQRIHGDRALIPALVEESLRHTPPIPVVMRNAAFDTEIAGVEVREGERVVIGVASANRDGAVYADPDTFSIDRDPAEPEHLAFTAGPHVCLGAGLARLEAAIAVEAFVDAFEPGTVALVPDYQFTTGPIYMEYGPTSLDVVVAP